jgi:protoporphyrinogen oxidase
MQVSVLERPAQPVHRESVAIVGGGLLGLTLALRLAERGTAVTVFESAATLGGLASAWQIGDVTWDRHYHVTLASDSALRGLLSDLDLDRQIEWSETGTGFFTDGRFHAMNGLLDFLRFPPLGLIDKLRLGLTILYASRIADPLPLEKISLERWLTRFSGRRTFEKIWRPLLRAKLGERYHEASAAFIWAIIVRLYAARRAGLGRERFGCVPGGYARVLRALRARLEALGVEIRLGNDVAHVVRAAQDGRVTVTQADGTTDDFDRAILTVPAPRAAQLAPGLNAEERRRLNSKTYQGIVCASLLLDEGLGTFYVTNLTDAWVPFSAVIETSALVDRRHFGGRALVYLPKYVAPDDPLFERDDAAIEEDFLSALERMYPHFKRSGVRAFRISRVRHVFPVATLDYSRDLPAISTSIPNLFVVNSSQIVNGTLNVNETVQLAERALVEISAGVTR